MNLVDCKSALKTLKSGLPIIFPTDTLPAIGCLPKFSNIITGKRGLGLIQGLVINDDYADAKKITLKAFDKGLLVVPAGGNVVRIVPPLVISRREINILLDKLNSIFEEL